MLDLSVKLIAAIKDTRFLLKRGYNRESCVRFVGDHYLLHKIERLMLYRGVYDDEHAKKHANKHGAINSIRGKKLAVDGYNVLITIESILLEKNLIFCDDGFVRDLSAIHGKYEQTELTKRTLKKIVDLTASYAPKEVIFFYDAQASMSGKLASLTRIMIKEAELNGDAKAVKQADLEVLKFGEVVASSDAVLIDKAEKVIDFAEEFLKMRELKGIVKLTEI
jgi:hypothetical protein